MQWGRLQMDIDCQLRRGAWYRVTRLAPLNAILDVNHKPLAIPQFLVEVVSTPPRRWTVVPRPRRAPRLPAEWGARYAVCPSCRERAALRGRPSSMDCRRCGRTFDVAWEEAYLTDG